MGAPERPLRVLLVESDPGVAHRVRIGLAGSEGGPFVVETRSRLAAALERLRADPPPDVILLDLTLPDGQGLAALAAVGWNAPRIPVVVLAARDDASLPVEAVREGAQDFVLSTDLAVGAIGLRLRLAVERDRWRVRFRQTLRAARGERSVLSDSVAMLSHDLKAPLAAILGYAELLREEPLGEAARTAIERIEANVERATMLAANVVEGIRIESGAVEPRREPVSVNEIVARAVAAYDGAARREGVAIETRLDPGIPDLPLDPNLVDRALMNLLSNAVRHSPHPGRVEVRTAHDGREIEVSVEDHGPGVPPEERPRLFQRFSVLRGSGTGGSGLGLHIARSLTEAQGGKVRFEAPPDGGARFTIRFPEIPT